MDDIFDSLIYIIISIVVLVFSLLGKKKKKVAQGMPSPENRNVEQKKPERPLLANLEQLLNEEMGISRPNFNDEDFEDEAEVEMKEKEGKNEILDTVPPEMLDNIPDIPYSIEHEDTSKVFSGAIKDTDLTKQEEEPVIDGFNLRDAVIYSEIINRKEY